MECEICGRYIEKGKRIRVENSTVVACNGCSGYGEVVGAVQLKVKKMAVIPKKPLPVADAGIEIDEENKEGELIDEYPKVIRKSREKLGIKQEELAKAINEPASLIHRIESGRIKPSPEVVRKIQKRLKIRLFDKSKEDSALIPSKSDSRELTLGDLVVVKKREKQW